MNEYYINYRYKDSKRFAAVKAYTPPAGHILSFPEYGALVYLERF
nr:MAG TPA: hypothetical protein [Caudoviricetes sp.]